MSKLDTWNALRMPIDAFNDCGYCKHHNVHVSKDPCLSCCQYCREEFDDGRIHWEYSGSKERQLVNESQDG